MALLGHSHPAVVQAIAAQAGELMFYSNVLPLDVRTRAAERLATFAPPGLSNVFFCNSGAEANENALKLALRHTGRTRIASLTGRLARPHAFVPGRDRRSQDHDALYAAAVRRDSPAARQYRRRRTRSTTRLRRSFWSRFRASRASSNSAASSCGHCGARCDETGTLLIYDEIQTGMGRLGRPLAAGDSGVTPDLATLAKGIANGIPMGAVLIADRIAAKIKIGDLASTFGGGPVACAALWRCSRRSSGKTSSPMPRSSAKRSTSSFASVRSRRCSAGVASLGLRVSGDAKALHRRLMDRGFITGTSANPQVLRLMPPINMPLEAVAELAAAL